MSAYTSLVASALFPAQERLKGHSTVRIRRELEQTQWWDGARLDEFRVSRLRALLAHAEQHVPYFRRLFAEIGFRSDELRSLADLRAIPFLTKPLIRENLDALKSERAEGLARFNTGGSSGEPLVFFIGRERVSHDVAAKWRATRWWDVDIGDPEIVVWGSSIELGAQDRVRGLRDRVMRTELLPAFEMSEPKLDDFLRRIRARRPKMLFGYPSALSLIAAHAEKRGVRMDDLGVRVAFVTAERPFEDQCDRIGRVFGCRVANGYGGRDAGFVAHECPAGGLHITAEDIVVEVVDPAGASVPVGEPGEIVVTHLATKDFPFVRYRTGDVGILDDRTCACGRGLPLMREIQGRTTDFVVAEDGTVMHGLALIYVLRDLPGIVSFKIIQETLRRTRVLVVPADGFDPRHLDTIRRGCRARLGERVDVDIELVERLDAEASGKFRYVVSHVDAARAPAPPIERQCA